MAFPGAGGARSTPQRGKGGPVFCVGWKVFVHSPADGAMVAPLLVTDPEGRPRDHDLADGQQVEILSWRPRSRESVLYQIRRIADGSEWWIAGRHLRPKMVAPVEVAAAAAKEGA